VFLTGLSRSHRGFGSALEGILNSEQSKYLAFRGDFYLLGNKIVYDSLLGARVPGRPIAATISASLRLH